MWMGQKQQHRVKTVLSACGISMLGVHSSPGPALLLTTVHMYRTNKSRQISLPKLHVCFRDSSCLDWSINVSRTSLRLCRFHQNEDAKLLKKVNLNRVYNHMAWCPNDLVACAHGNELHWMNGVELCCQILDAHDGEITDISCTPRKVKIYAEQYFAVTTASRDGKARIWKCPEIC